MCYVGIWVITAIYVISQCIFESCLRLDWLNFLYSNNRSDLVSLVQTKNRTLPLLHWDMGLKAYNTWCWLWLKKRDVAGAHWYQCSQLAEEGTGNLLYKVTQSHYHDTATLGLPSAVSVLETEKLKPDPFNDGYRRRPQRTRLTIIGSVGF